MPYRYSDTTRESDPNALPNVEVFESAVWTVDCDQCGDVETYSYGRPHDRYMECPNECGSSDTQRPVRKENRTGFWYAFGSPGCLWDSEPVGPFDTEAEALADARKF